MIPVGSPYPIRIDLFSDTITRPSGAMRQAMAHAEVGDEQKGEDPSTNELVALARELLGKEEAVFLPSGTMCNQISYALHCRPGDAILVDDNAHSLCHEETGAPALAGALFRPIKADRGVFSADQLTAALGPEGRSMARNAVLSIEQPSNLGGGTCWSLEGITSVTAVARAHQIKTHMDGARLLNAVVATGVSARDFCAPFDSVWLDLSKGLGAPLGAVLAGDADFISEAWRLKQRWGGSMRQSGIVAAAGTFALRNNVDRLADDHANARLLAELLAGHRNISIDPTTVQTNIVLFDLVDCPVTAPVLVERLLRKCGVRMGAFGPSTIRAVTHLDVDTAGVRLAAEALCELLDETYSMHVSKKELLT
ncbi:threonine aldolase family protein [Paenarthrobacter ureafaciens]|uniref:threonine aldolase family protein n=1 Tax=Paenarthrobacter ureafaciens TaxID=37931 RepID=UPI003CF9973B